MKINVISHNNGHSLTEDSQTLAYTIKKLYRKKKIKFDYFSFRAPSAKVGDVNIFVGIINYNLFKYAPINILVVDPHKFNKKWIPVLKKIDYVLVKTRYSYDIMSSFMPKEKIINIGWKNKDYLETSVTKDLNSFFTICGHSTYRQVDKLIEIWKEDYPKLTVLCGKNYFKNIEIEKKEQDNIEYIDKYLPIDEFVKMINEKGIHICLGSATSFANTLHLCQTVKSIPITLDCVLYNKYVANNIDGFLVKTKKKSKLKYTLGSEYKVEEEDLQITIERIIKIQKEDEILLEEMSDRNKKNVRSNEMEFDRNFKDFFDKVWTQHKTNKTLETKIEIYEEDFPTVSIITPTYNKRKFIKLAVRNFQKTDYPKDKIEWVIVDDGEEEIKDLLPEDSRIKYTKLSEQQIEEYKVKFANTKKHEKKKDKKEDTKDTEDTKNTKDNKNNLTVGMKRNIACDLATGEYIVCMDDDDYYSPPSVKFRIANLLHFNKKVVGCSSLGTFNINKIISNINISSYSLSYDYRIFEHTLGFTKKHWEDNHFYNESITEGVGLLENNIENYEEIYWENICISLKHYGNTNERVKIEGETNGSHFNISDEVFNLLTNIEETEEEDKEMVKKHDEELNKKKEEAIQKDKDYEAQLDKELEES